MPEYDVIVVGAGSVGCVVAARLCANSAARVLLLEAGGAQRTGVTEVPSAWAELLGDEAEWGLVTTLQAGAWVTMRPPLGAPRDLALRGRQGPVTVAPVPEVARLGSLLAIGATQGEEGSLTFNQDTTTLTWDFPASHLCVSVCSEAMVFHESQE